MLSILIIAQLIGFVLLLSCGQVLFKKAAITSPPLNNLEGLLALSFNLWFWLALALYGVATLMWVILLQKVNLSIAYPFSALGFIIVPLSAWAIYGEKITFGYAAGVILIIAGLCVVSLKA